MARGIPSTVKYDTQGNRLPTSQTVDESFYAPTPTTTAGAGMALTGVQPTVPTSAGGATTAVAGIQTTAPTQPTTQPTGDGGAGGTVSTSTANVNWQSVVTRLRQQIANAQSLGLTPQQIANLQQQLANAQQNMAGQVSPNIVLPEGYTPGVSQGQAVQGVPTQQEQLQQTTQQQQVVAQPTQQAVTQPSVQTGQVTQGTTGTQPNQQYTSPYSTVQQDLLNQLLGSQFSYDPATDAGLQQAGSQMERQVMQTMQQRGILNSTMTADAIAGGWAQLIPQYEAVARGNWESEQDRLASLLGIVNQLDQQAYGAFVDQWEMDWKTQQQAYEQQMNEIELRRQEIADAWTRVRNMGYVDDEASAILGIPVGTRSAEAQAKIDAFNQELLLMEAEIQQAIAIDMGKLQNEAQIMQQQSQAYAPTAQQQLAYETYKRGFRNMSAIDTLNYIVSTGEEQYINNMGETLYNQWIAELQEEVMNPTYFDVYSSNLYKAFKDEGANQNTFNRILQSTYSNEEKEAVINALFHNVSDDKMKKWEDEYLEKYGE